MRKRFEGKKFDGFRDCDGGSVYREIEFHHCTFANCVISVTSDPRLRCTLKNIKAVGCDSPYSLLQGAILENVFVEGFDTHGEHLLLFACVFNKVILKGAFGVVLLRHGVTDQEVQERFNSANAEYYRKVKWALDITEGEFVELDVEAVPTRLIRRDPETQIIVTREKTKDGRWKKLKYKDSVWPFSIGEMIENGRPDVVLVAGKRHPKFKKALADFQMLRAEGIAEPD